MSITSPVLQKAMSPIAITAKVRRNTIIEVIDLINDGSFCGILSSSVNKGVSCVVCVFGRFSIVSGDNRRLWGTTDGLFLRVVPEDDCVRDQRDEDAQKEEPKCLLGIMSEWFVIFSRLHRDIFR